MLEEDAILATNTSSIDLNEMGIVLKRPERLVGMHFFNPAPAMALVEVVQSTETDSEVADMVFSLAEQWGKARYMSAPVRDTLSTAQPALFTVKLWLFSKKVELMRQPVMP